jgi:hypothetical protein
VAELDFTCEMDALGTPQLAGQYTGEVWLNGGAFDDRLAWVGVFALDAADHLTPDTMGYVTIGRIAPAGIYDCRVHGAATVVIPRGIHDLL